MIFRAKDLDGNFVYGMPVYDENKSMTKMFTETQEIIDILPWTVGIFTGFRDKNGEDIYVGDEVTLELFDPHEIRHFQVQQADFLDRTYTSVINGESFCARLACVIYFRFLDIDGSVKNLLPVVHSDGHCDTEDMEIVKEK